MQGGIPRRLQSSRRGGRRDVGHIADATKLFERDSIYTVDIQFKVEPKTIGQGGRVEGSILVSYPGRYDGVVVNAQVLDSNHHVTYASCNDRMLTGKIARLFIPRDQMPDNRAAFTAKMEFAPDRAYEIKFRASIIEQHKEIESSIKFVEYTE